MYMFPPLPGVYDEVKQMKEACGSAHLKTILATGELGSLTTVYTASMVCMMAGGTYMAFPRDLITYFGLISVRESGLNVVEKFNFVFSL